MDLAIALFSLGPATSTIHQRTQQELHPPMPWGTGLPTSVLAVDPEAVCDLIPVPLGASPAHPVAR